MRYKEYDGISKKMTKKGTRFTQQGSNIASEVKIYKDPSLVKARKDKAPRTKEEKRIDEEQQRKDKATYGGDQLSSMGLESSMGKDERIFKLQSLINNKEVVTLQSAMSELGLAKGTVVSYLREINYQMWDAKDGQFRGAKDGIKVGVEDNKEEDRE